MTLLGYELLSSKRADFLSAVNVWYLGESQEQDLEKSAILMPVVWRRVCDQSDKNKLLSWQQSPDQNCSPFQTRSVLVPVPIPDPIQTKPDEENQKTRGIPGPVVWTLQRNNNKHTFVCCLPAALSNPTMQHMSQNPNCNLLSSLPNSSSVQNKESLQFGSNSFNQKLQQMRLFGTHRWFWYSAD
ncbi:hypothetical protein B0H13DRAFT_1872230 [Mycena leptocephala]|nr:hypothetical protein B0H13DRAFT_1872230 [Mycena leptocephala]